MPNWDTSLAVSVCPFFACILIFILHLTLRSPHVSAKTYSHASPDDVIQVRRILLKHFPPELANLILDEAEYWPRIVATRRERVIVDTAHSENSDASLHYLIMPPIPPTGGLRVKRVEFFLMSHDQGWSNTPEFHGTYEGSFTWFEAAILRPRYEEDNPPEPRLTPGWANGFGLFSAPPPPPPCLTDFIQIENPNADTGCWHIQTNRCAHGESLIHYVVWGVGGVAQRPRTCNGPGSGDGKGFIDMLESGDRIAVIARAKFPRWVNFVDTGYVAVFYAV
ncbi:hypothetical protein FB45DRAFT_431964 [Roridomyces roridus]|uniref:Uncharacterized protein n=1 Tax=Roridomyces roridus TaxID=1738132 RepID=A0AAD7F7I6_9AGAR|nr:hypothetical protein FB45DRAFT_431964 [Roridomyces roridus]